VSASIDGATPTVSVATATHTRVTTHLVRIQASTDAGRPGVSIEGLPADQAHTTLDRLRAAVVNSGLPWPTQPVALRVFPHPLSTGDAGLDLAFALGLLAATGRVPVEPLATLAVVGELGLDGRLRTVPTVAARAAAIAGAGFPHTIVAAGDLAAAVRVLGDGVAAVSTLRDLAAALHGQAGLLRAPAWPSATPRPEVDLAELRVGQPGRRVVEVAAAGGHHLALFGPAGSGNVMLAERLPGLLPDTDEATAAQVARLYRAAGLLAADAPVVHRPPWQAPHHTSSLAALTGTATRPGAAALAHGGVLFLDAAAELPDRAVRALRTVVDAGQVHVAATGGGMAQWPARFQLLLATPDSPAPWRHTGGPCDCSPEQRHRYLRRLAPLLERVELRVTLPALAASSDDQPGGEPTSTVAARVAQARAAAAARWARYGWATNAQAATTALHTDLAGRWAAHVTGLRARRDATRLSFDDAIRVLAVAWTLADLAGRDTPSGSDIAEAIRLHDPRVPGREVR
jgi:magnesium chelatase family protein